MSYRDTQAIIGGVMTDTEAIAKIRRLNPIVAERQAWIRKVHEELGVTPGESLLQKISEATPEQLDRLSSNLRKASRSSA